MGPRTARRTPGGVVDLLTNHALARLHPTGDHPERPERLIVLDGETIEQDADGLLATCVQHEIDHLNGVLFLDHLSKLKRDRVITKFKKAAKRAAGA